MLHALFKRRIRLALACAIVLALVLPMTALGADKKPSQNSTRNQTVSCTTVTTTPDGNTTQKDCSPQAGGYDYAPDPNDSNVNPFAAQSTGIDAMDSFLGLSMRDLF